ncbi:hypothetical protein BJ508DRAFT_132658 [Ascobolus immersus RN42]|uniref:F-box domain-containing protein n=1 Tax=Ascobolus immersus RN42 TaxID=1160509 RepID=A0A3N4IE04_ASCIM|nr:hypothetical protein BJ508DRAFT_132658 [Ascobolus immersus RN42]
MTGNSLPAMTLSRSPNSKISRLPLDITYQILSYLPDVEKIKITRVCKAWQSSVRTWAQLHTRKVYETYPDILPNPTPEWEHFYKAVKISSLRPSATPSSSLKMDSIRAKVVNTSKYAAWVDGSMLHAGRMPSNGGGLEDGHFSKPLAELLSIDSKYWGEVLWIDNETGIVVVSICDDDLEGLFGFDIEKSALVWVTDLDGNEATIGKATSHSNDQDWKLHRSTAFTDGLLIKFSKDPSTRIFQLWEINSNNGKQRCIQKDLLYHPLFAFTKGSHARFERTSEGISQQMRAEGPDFHPRRSYKADTFSFRRLPFKNEDGVCDHVAVAYSFDFTGAALGPFAEEAIEEMIKLEEAVEESHEDHFHSFQNAEGTISKGGALLKDPGMQDETMPDASKYPPGLDMDHIEVSFADQSALLSHPTLGQNNDACEGSRTFFLIYNTTTGELVQRLHMPGYRYHFAPNDYRTIADQEVADIINGVNSGYVRYPNRLQIRISDLVLSDQSSAAVKIDIIQESKIQNIRSAYGMHCSADLPECWSLTARFTKGATEKKAPSFSFDADALTCSLYKVFMDSLATEPLVTNLHLESRLVINPLYRIGVYNASIPDQGHLFHRYSHFPSEVYDESDDEFDDEFDDIPDLPDMPQPVRAPPLHGPRPAFEIPKDIPAGANSLPEIAVFEEVVERRIKSLGCFSELDGHVWTYKWFNVASKHPIYQPLVEGQDPNSRMRFGWEGRVDRKGNVEDNSPLEIDEHGIKFSGIWLWD